MVSILSAQQQTANHQAQLIGQLNHPADSSVGEA
jgi:hypothetical protein